MSRNKVEDLVKCFLTNPKMLKYLAQKDMFVMQNIQSNPIHLTEFLFFQGMQQEEKYCVSEDS